MLFISNILLIIKLKVVADLLGYVSLREPHMISTATKLPVLMSICRCVCVCVRVHIMCVTIRRRHVDHVSVLDAATVDQ